MSAPRHKASFSKVARSIHRAICGSWGLGAAGLSHPRPRSKLVPARNCNPPAEIGQTGEPQGTRWKDGKLYLTTRHRGILVYDPQTKQVNLDFSNAAGASGLRI